MTREEFLQIVEKIVNEKVTQAMAEKEAERKHIPVGEAKDLVSMKQEFLRVVLFNDSHAKAALGMSEGSGSAGGYLVPEALANEIIQLASKYGLARKYFRVVPMPRNKFGFPTVASGVTAYWVDEAGSITKSNATLGLVQLEAKKLAALAPLTYELVEDSPIDVIDFIYEQIARAFAEKEDEACLTGNGTPFYGILNDSGVTVVQMDTGETSFTDINFDYLEDLINAVDDAARDNGMFIMHPTIKGVLRKKKTSTNEYLWGPPGAGTPPTLMGYPYVLSSKMPGVGDSAADTPFVIFGDPRYFLFGDRKQQRMQIAREGTISGTSLLETDQLAVKVIERVAGKVAVGSAFAVLKTAAS